MKKASLQDIFLNNIRKEKINVTIFLSNGVKLQGNVIAFDSFVIALKKDTNMQIIYKHSISTIIPSKFVNLQPDLQSESTVDE